MIEKENFNRFGYRADQKITDFLATNKFTVSAEVIPPRNGAEQVKILNQIESLIENGAQFLSVTKGAGGSLRGGSLPIAQMIKEKFSKTAIAHFTCRDLSPQEIENQLMDHHYFGVRNILALRGDPPADQPNWQPHESSYQYAYQLIEQIQRLNRGDFLKRPGQNENPDHEATDFCVGAAAYPEHPNQSERIEFFKKKVEAGAEYGITQMLFDEERYSEFLESLDAKNVRVPILPGSLILKSKEQAQNISRRFQVSVSKKWLSRLPEKKEDSRIEDCIEMFLEFAEGLKAAGAPGLHLFVLSDTKSCSRAISKMTEHLSKEL